MPVNRTGRWKITTLAGATVEFVAASVRVTSDSDWFEFLGSDGEVVGGFNRREALAITRNVV
jgi:hypothetical protein